LNERRPLATGRPAHAPGDLSKLYVYGYMNQMFSSRRLEREGRSSDRRGGCRLL